MTNSTDDMRKSISILTEGEQVNETPLMAHDFTDEAAKETKVEVTFKDDDHIDVNVHAESGDELNRLMDLAGVFHSGKETADNLAPTSMDLAPEPVGALDLPMDTMVDPMAPDVPMDEPMADPMDAPVDTLDTEVPDMAADPMDDPMMDPMSDPLAPAMDEPMMDPMADSIMDEMEGSCSCCGDSAMCNCGPECECGCNSMMGEAEVSAVVAGQEHDYGHPNPLAGQQPAKQDAFSFSGHGAKPVRYVPARSGDNAMDDPATTRDDLSTKGLREFMEEIEGERIELSEKKSPEDVVADAKAHIPTTINQMSQQTMDDSTADLGKKPGAVNLDPEEMINDVAADLDPRTADQLKRGFDDAEAEGEMDEARYQHNYTFRNSVLPFQGLTGAQRIKRNAFKSAKRNIQGKKK